MTNFDEPEFAPPSSTSDRAYGRAVRFRCRIGFWEMVGHLVLWLLLIIVTLGIAFFFYIYRVNRVVMEETTIEYY